MKDTLYKTPPFSFETTKTHTKKEDFAFWKNLILTSVFFILTPITLSISLFSLFSLNNSSLLTKNTSKHNLTPSFSGIQVYASLPSKLPAVSGKVEGADARAVIIKNYLESYDSPLVSFSDQLLEAADKYKLDYRLLPAIAQQESNLCKIIPPGSHNCWGWGIHSQGNLGFNSYPEAIDTVAYGLRSQYIDKGYKTVTEIMSKYNPNSPDGAWGKGVSQFMSEMQ